MSIVSPDTPPRVPGQRSTSDMKFKWALYHFLVTSVVALLYIFVICTKDGASIFHTRAANTDVAITAPLITQSPLRELSWLDTVAIPLSDDDNRILSEIESRAALNIKFFAIPEIVYVQDETDRLYEYVEKQLKLADDVVTGQQADVILKLIESEVAQGSMMKKEMGSEGSLKNSMVVAILKEHKGNVHFAMAGVSLEPRLGWRFITKRQRNAWNEVLTRVLDTRLKQQMSMLVK